MEPQFPGYARLARRFPRRAAELRCLFPYLAARGEYGSTDLEEELSRAVQDPGRDMRIECTRPDGRVVEVRRNAVPGGGFVVIYSDVTERKRAEAEIRAARDAAEKALGE